MSFEIGFCVECNKEFVLENGSLPNHESVGHSSVNEEGFCHASRCSARNVKLVLDAQDEAIRIAQAIVRDIGMCLVDGSVHHSMSCGDGRRCSERRLYQSQALAAYFLHFNKD